MLASKGAWLLAFSNELPDVHGRVLTRLTSSEVISSRGFPIVFDQIMLSVSAAKMEVRRARYT